MNGVVMLGPPCLCSRVSHSPAAQATAIAETSSSSFGSRRLSRLGHLRPLKKVRPARVQAVVELNGQPVSKPPLRSSREAKVVLMVDPLEAKRLAAVEWKLLQKRAAFQKQQQIEAINGGWAVLGLTIGLILEGYTGKGILAQVAGYLDSLADFLARLTPGS